MTPFFIWLIKSSISLSLLYVVFKLFVSRDKLHTVNRFVLLGILLTSVIFPLLNIQFFHKEIQVSQITVSPEVIPSPVFSIPALVTGEQPVRGSYGFAINPWNVFYLLPVVVLGMRLVVGVLHVEKIIRKAEKQRLHKIVLAIVNDIIQPFSFMNKIVLSKKDFTENKDILVAHESAHIRHFHTIDMIICELFAVLHWFNPFIWLLRRDLKLTHEYQADQAVLKAGIDIKKYQLLVLEKAVGERRFAMALHFTQKPVLKRLMMMKEPGSQRLASFRLILFVPVLIILLQAFARPGLMTKPKDFIPVRYTEDKAEKWLSDWTVDNIGKGIFQPETKAGVKRLSSQNPLVILMNARNEYLVDGKITSKEDIKVIVGSYLLEGHLNNGKTRDLKKRQIPFIGQVTVPDCLISYKHDIESSNEAVNYTLRQIGEAYLEAREAKAFILFGKKYFDLDKDKLAAVDMVVPVRFSYEYPKAPPASVWLPFDEKPSPKPDPLEILVKYDGTVYLGKQRFENIEALQQTLLAWKEELKELDEDERTKHYYRANLTYEHGDEPICYEEQKRVGVILWRSGVNVEWIKNLGPESKMSLQMDKLIARKKKVEKSVKDSLSISNQLP